jgi:mercuric ion binding protein
MSLLKFKSNINLMKNLKHLLFIIFSALATSVFAQDKTESVKVYGNCEMCKSRIEKALTVDGVKKADWDVDTKMLTVTYDGGKPRSSFTPDTSNSK